MFIPFQQIFFSYAEDLSINLVEGGVITCLFLSSGNEIFHIQTGALSIVLSSWREDLSIFFPV